MRADAAVVIGSALVVAMFAGCAPALIVPAEGTRLGYESCGVTPTGVAVYRYESPCPDMTRVAERVRRVRERYRGCAFDGVRLYVVGAYVECGGEYVHGCTIGDRITVQGDPASLATIEHELRHFCISQMEGPSSWGHHDLDKRRERLDAEKRDRNPLGLGEDD